jgi:hypothetical protein
MVFEHLQNCFQFENSAIISSMVPTLFSYCIRSHSTSNCTCPWNSSFLSHDQPFRWSSSPCSAGNIVYIHKPHLMSSIS